LAAIPTITELYNSIRSQLEAELNIQIPVFGKVVLNAIALVQAAKLKLFWLAIADVRKNVFVDTADPESIGGTLERFGRVKLGRSPFAATQGLYTCQVNGTIGATIPAGTIFKSDDASSNSGKLFRLDTAKVLAAAIDTIQLRALEAGLDARLSVNDTLTATSPLINVDDQVLVTAEDEQPLAAEDLEVYRDLTIRAFQLESQGGAATDYRAWSADAQGVRFVYPYATSGKCSEVDVYVEANQADSTDGKGTPTTAIKTAVEEVIEFDPDTTRPLEERGRRPVQVVVNIIDVTPLDVIITINNPVNIGVDTQAAIASALTAEIDDIRPFVEAADILENKNDILDINRVTAIIQNLLTGNQQFDSTTLNDDAVNIPTPITLPHGDIPFLDRTVSTYEVQPHLHLPKLNKKARSHW